MLVRFIARICGEAARSARRLHRSLGDEMRDFSHSFFQQRRFVRFRAEWDHLAGVCSEAVSSAWPRKNLGDETWEFFASLYEHRLKRGKPEGKLHPVIPVVDYLFALNALSMILKFPAVEPAALEEFTAEKIFKEEAMKWRFEEWMMIEHSCTYKDDGEKVRLFKIFKECAQDAEKRNTTGGAAFETDKFWCETEQEFHKLRQ